MAPLNSRLRSVAGYDLALVAVAALAFSVSAPLAKLVTGLSPIGVAAGRTAVATAAIVLWAPRSTWDSIRRLSAPERPVLAAAGALLAIHFGFFLVGLHETSLPAAVALVSLEPLSVVLAAWLAFGLRPTRREGFGVALATVGGLVVAQGAGQGEHRRVGDLLVVAAVLVYGAYVAVARRLRDAMPVLPYAAATYGVATLLLAPLAMVLAAGAPPPPGRTWGVVLALGIIPTLIGHTLVQRSARSLPPSIVALVSPGETIGSLAIGALFLRAMPSAAEMAGALLIVLGASVAVTGSR